MPLVGVANLSLAVRLEGEITQIKDSSAMFLLQVAKNRYFLCCLCLYISPCSISPTAVSPCSSSSGSSNIQASLRSLPPFFTQPWPASVAPTDSDLILKGPELKEQQSRWAAAKAAADGISISASSAAVLWQQVVEGVDGYSQGAVSAKDAQGPA